MYYKRIYKTGTSLVITLPYSYLSAMGVGKGDTVKLSYTGDAIKIEPANVNAVSDKKGKGVRDG